MLSKVQFFHLIFPLNCILIFVILLFVSQNNDNSFKDFHQNLISDRDSELDAKQKIAFSMIDEDFILREDNFNVSAKRVHYDEVDTQKIDTTEKPSKLIDRKKVFKKYANKKKIVPRFKISKSKKVTTKGLSSDRLILKYVGKDF